MNAVELIAVASEALSEAGVKWAFHQAEMGDDQRPRLTVILIGYVAPMDIPQIVPVPCRPEIV